MFKEESFEFKTSDCILHAVLGELYWNGVSERELIPQAVAPARWAVKWCQFTPTKCWSCALNYVVMVFDLNGTGLA